MRRVTDHPAIDAIPAWSQDGSRIVFVSERIAKGQRRLSVLANVRRRGHRRPRRLRHVTPDHEQAQDV